MVHLEEPLNLLDQYADMVAMLEEKGGRLNASREECWQMVREDAKITSR